MDLGVLEVTVQDNEKLWWQGLLYLASHNQTFHHRYIACIVETYYHHDEVK
jgi:hypothetical protein